MLKFLIFSVLILTSFRCGSSLYCQVTNLDKLINTREVVHSAQNCDAYLNNIMPKFFENEKHEELRSLSTSASCYTARVTTDDPSTNFVVKGCVPKGKCDQFVTPTIKREAKVQGVTITKLKCAECDGERCNAY
ncbi:uncharacterized protein LOC135137670 [Zophobas morio]|uniref:uncharacterized protein LOC135137670 n=1 Tax=Zophobas morio TaxID=2755281 RepID=UPI0030826EEA